ncbi:MAG: hypothetical protein M1825_000018 [Sarcosagium campestre]|nr:MAG: hypothetical protein M1825_000018 [Sarcosagium campestre]
MTRKGPASRCRERSTEAQELVEELEGLELESQESLFANGFAPVRSKASLPAESSTPGKPATQAVGRPSGSKSRSRQSRQQEALSIPVSVEVPPLPRPIPSEEYLNQSLDKSEYEDLIQPLLLVLDLNGTLLCRNRTKRTITPRPEMRPFLRYIFDKFTVMIWSSATPRNVDEMCRNIFTAKQRKRIVAQWSRDRLGLTKEQYCGKVQVYKNLDQIWQDAQILASHPARATGEVWSQKNTILLDDSIVKAASHPFNILEIPEFIDNAEKSLEEQRPLKQVITYLEQARRQANVSSFIRQSPFRLGGTWCESFAADIQGFE